MPPSVAVPETASWSYWLPAVVPPMSMSRAARGGLGVAAVDRQRARDAGAAGDDLAAVGDIAIDDPRPGQGTTADEDGTVVERPSAEIGRAPRLGVQPGVNRGPGGDGDLTRVGRAASETAAEAERPGLRVHRAGVVECDLDVGRFGVAGAGKRAGVVERRLRAGLRRVPDELRVGLGVEGGPGQVVDRGATAGRDPLRPGPVGDTVRFVIDRRAIEVNEVTHGVDHHAPIGIDGEGTAERTAVAQGEHAGGSEAIGATQGGARLDRQRAGRQRHRTAGGVDDEEDEGETRRTVEMFSGGRQKNELLIVDGGACKDRDARDGAKDTDEVIGLDETGDLILGGRSGRSQAGI